MGYVERAEERERGKEEGGNETHIKKHRIDREAYIVTKAKGGKDNENYRGLQRNILTKEESRSESNELEKDLKSWER